ncbi:hypothetical protein Aperf_G00000020385 [Anoplocephala perfoliata]
MPEEFAKTDKFTAQSSTVVGPLRDLTDGAAPKTSKSDFASNVSRFFESRKMKVSKNPPPPPARIIKGTISRAPPTWARKGQAECRASATAAAVAAAAANRPTTAENTSASEKVGQKVGGSGSLYDDAWDIRLARFGLQTSSAKSGQEAKDQQGQEGGRGPPDGAATRESTCSLASASSSISSSSKVMILDSASKVSDSVSSKVTASANNTISTFTSSAANSASKSSAGVKPTPTCNGDVVPASVSEADPTDGVATPTPCNNSNWFPPPPPTPLHLSLHADEPVDSQPGRYHEHRRSFEMDDDTDQIMTKMNSNGDAITLPPLSPPPPPPPPPLLQEGATMNGGGRASVASFLLNLPPPPPVADLANGEAPSPPVIPPRDPKTSVTVPSSEPPVTDLDCQPTATETQPLVKQRVKNDSGRTRVQQPQRKAGVDGRSVVPWERAAPVPPSVAIDFSGSLPQWVPPQHSEASALHHRTTRSIGHRSSKSQSGCEDLLISQDDTDCARTNRPLSLAVSGRSQSQHRGGRRRTTHSFGDDFVDAALETPTNDGSRGRRTIRMNSDSSGMAKAQTMIATGDVWAAAAGCDGGSFTDAADPVL